MAKRATEYDGIFVGAGMTALQGVWREASAAFTCSNNRASPGPVYSQSGFLAPLAGRIPAPQHSPQGKPVTFSLLVRSRTTAPCDFKKAKTGSTNGSRRRSGSVRAVAESPPSGRSNSVAGQIFLDEWRDATGRTTLLDVSGRRRLAASSRRATFGRRRNPGLYTTSRLLMRARTKMLE